MEQVILLHREFVQAGPLVHRDKLEGAVATPFQVVFDVELYPTITAKAVKLVDGISRAQAFMDGNKRLAWLTMVTFVQANGLILQHIDPEEAALWVIGLKGDETGLTEGTIWLNRRLDNTI